MGGGMGLFGVMRGFRFLMDVGGFLNMGFRGL